MIHIKLFEELTEPIYFWKVRADAPYLEYSLIKLGATKTQIRNMVNNINIKDDKYIYIAPKAADKSKDNNHLAWNHENKKIWDDITLNSGYDGFIKQGYIYKGEVEITPEEIEMMRNQNKYNL